MTESIESSVKGNWSIATNDHLSKHQRTIVNASFPAIGEEAYNYEIYTPVVLAPISKSSTLILSAYDNKGKLGLRIHDLRFIDDAASGSISFTLHGNPYQLGKMKNEMNRVCDSDRCIGVLFLFRKLFYGGFRSIMADRKLHTRESDTLQTILGLVKGNITMEEKDG